MDVLISRKILIDGSDIESIYVTNEEYSIQWAIYFERTREMTVRNPGRTRERNGVVYHESMDYKIDEALGEYHVKSHTDE